MVFNALQIRSPESNELKLQHAVKFDFQVVIGKTLGTLLQNDFIRHLILLDYLNLGRDLYIATKCLNIFQLNV